MMHAPTIGVIAGMGPSSTPRFLELLYDECRSQYGAAKDEDFPHIVLYSLPTPYGDGSHVDHGEMQATIAACASRMRAFGCGFLAMPCNTSHRYLPAIRESAVIDVLDMVAATVDDALEIGKRIGIIATAQTIEWGGYQAKVTAAGAEAIVCQEVQYMVDSFLANLTEGVIPQGLLASWETLVQRFVGAGADCLIVGCTDLGVLIQDGCALPCIDSGRSLSRRSVEHFRILAAVSR
jgi:aspartate racemase